MIRLDEIAGEWRYFWVVWSEEMNDDDDERRKRVLLARILKQAQVLR